VASRCIIASRDRPRPNWINKELPSVPVALTPMDALAHRVEALIALLDHAEEPYWKLWMERALVLLDDNRLAGVSRVLAAYGGQDTFSDLVLSPQLADSAPHRFSALNEQLEELRSSIFELANIVSSGTASL